MPAGLLSRTVCLAALLNLRASSQRLRNGEASR
jgi:hypothetical protein